MKYKKRIEFDSLGPKKIDFNKLWGAQTQRSIENFQIGNEKIPKELIPSVSLANWIWNSNKYECK